MKFTNSSGKEITLGQAAFAATVRFAVGVFTLACFFYAAVAVLCF